MLHICYIVKKLKPYKLSEILAVLKMVSGGIKCYQYETMWKGFQRIVQPYNPHKIILNGSYIFCSIFSTNRCSDLDLSEFGHNKMFLTAFQSREDPTKTIYHLGCVRILKMS